MGELQLCSNVLNDDDSASLFSLQSPLSGASSPARLLTANAKRRASARRRRHVIVRLICSPFTAVFRTTCSRASASDDQAGGAGDERRESRRPSLEQLLRIEASSPVRELKAGAEPDMVDDPYDPWKDSAIVLFDFDDADDDMGRTEKDEARLATSKHQHHDVPGDEQQMAIVPVDGADAGQPAVTLLMNVKRLVLVLAEMRARSRGMKGSYGRLAGGRAGDGKAEMFYDRPIPLGRRCRVQHLEESPYL